MNANLKTITMSEWIPVKDRLPQIDHQRVAIYFPRRLVNPIDFAYYNKNGNFFFTYSTGSINEGDVTHWMPLPEPPKS